MSVTGRSDLQTVRLQFLLLDKFHLELNNLLEYNCGFTFWLKNAGKEAGTKEKEEKVAEKLL